ncbi:probable bifunctional methylenetetrahydrofolate dehydrogenase/cyclohydrolase 2 isoform X2 [Phyllostomus discolor]|uniref:Probable bifunctional methylenetetrahydrofolate dehydrogenase/cyclohydrolase 2 isoform X2 n=1 Tax=Phyllostomus discolor TaxID=89673 RepID=A0A6J2L4P8_9CHIR|nr:probable bifunctional methylenetetrahydrofolate dehydrogenase/cyclohydrolase 2 isoform X2 [Phyllostomus discolor]
MALRKPAARGTCPPARPGRGGTQPAAARTRAARGEPPSRSLQFSAMAVPARTFSMLRSYLGRVPGLGGGAAWLVGAQGAAGPTFRGFQSSGVRTSREKRCHLPEVATVCLPTGPHPQSSFF